MISLQALRNRLVTAESYIKTVDANNYIATQATCSSTNNLGGRGITTYTCGGSCSWTCSGGCSKGAGG